MRTLLVTPPILQINTPYPATAYLTGFLRSRGHDVGQADLGLALALRIFSREGLQKVFAEVPKKLEHLYRAEDYIATIDAVIRFLQGKDDSVALRICARKWLPEGPRFQPLQAHAELLDGFGELAVRDQAKYLASLYLDDIADLVRLAIDEDFELARYGERLAAAQNSFSPLYERLTNSDDTLIDQWIDEETEKAFSNKIDVLGLSCPFPGNVYGALRIAKKVREISPKTKIIFGGGFANTELRELDDPRFFEFVDFLCIDDGERPLELILEHLHGKRDKSQLLRTRFLENGKVNASPSREADFAFKNLPVPDYDGIDFSQYISMMELPNPMHRMWSDFRWNKMTLAHGCYWKKCTFCDTSLDYIGRYEPQKVDTIVAHMKAMAAQTGSNGFHFVDEAAPPAILKALALRLKEERLPFTWWGNLRFDKQFTPELAQLMADAGCVAVTGGIEVASPRILKLIEKGVSVEQVARVTKAFSDAGIFVHAYLMYGFPSQTVQETVDSLEVVRQLFKTNSIQSAHWHRFVATIHSPVGMDPEKYGIKIKADKKPKHGWFARNALKFSDSTHCDHDALGKGLRAAVFNFVHGVGLDNPLRSWFESGIPQSKVPRNFIANALKGENVHVQKSAHSVESRI